MYSHSPTHIYYVQYLHRADNPRSHTLSRNQRLIHTGGPLSGFTNCASSNLPVGASTRTRGEFPRVLPRLCALK